MTGEERYELTFRKEILWSLAASVNGAYIRYEQRNTIDGQNETNPIVADNNETFSKKHEIILSRTHSELDVIEERLKELQKRINELEAQEDATIGA